MQVRDWGRARLTSLAIVLPVGSSAFAQVGQAELRRTVLDDSGGTLPGVTVTATHIDTGTTRTTVTSTSGVFLMPALQVGRYRLQLELTGFNTIVQDNLPLEVGQSAVLTFTMKVATLQETITVAGESPLVETQKSDLAGRVTATQVESLPLNGRNWLDLVALVPGARGNPGTIRAGFGGSDMAKYQVDGVDVSGQCCGGANQGYSQENIQEFEVITNRYDAEYSRAAGVVINAVTKSGSNQIRGTAFAFLRDSDLGDAPNFFTHKVETFHEKQMGANGGGPIRRDRAFYFASYEYQHRDLKAIPRTGFAAFDVPVDNGITRHYTTGRVDAQINNAHRLFARSSIYNWEQINVGVGERSALSNGYSRPSKNRDLSIGETWVVSSRMVHEIRAGFSAIDNQLLSNSTMPLHTFPSIVIGSPTNSPQWWKEFNIQINNSLSYFIPSWHGEHSLKTGFQFFRPKFWGAFPSGTPDGASYTFSRDPADPNDPRTYPAPTRYSVVLGDPSYTDPLGGVTFDDLKRQNLPRDMTVIANDYKTPAQDQVSLGVAQQLGSKFALQLDFVHSKCFNEPRARRINFFEDPVTHLPKDPRVYGRPYSQFIDITQYETTAGSLYNGWQFGFHGRELGPRWARSQFSGSYTLSWTHSDHESNRFDGVTNPFNLADEWAFSASDQRHRFIVNDATHLPWNVQVAAIFFAGSKRPINTRTNLDPFGTGTGRWLDATGRTIARNSERTTKNDCKLDLRISKTVEVGRIRLQGIVEAFNLLNIENLTSFNGVYGSNTYLQPASSTDVFYQPRQFQFAFRINY